MAFAVTVLDHPYAQTHTGVHLVWWRARFVVIRTTLFSPDELKPLMKGGGGFFNKIPPKMAPSGLRANSL